MVERSAMPSTRAWRKCNWKAETTAVVRASYARYAGQLNPFEVTSASPVGAYYTYIAYRWNDTNNDGFAQRGEILTNLGPQYSNAIDPAHPTSVESPNTIDDTATM